MVRSDADGIRCEKAPGFFDLHLVFVDPILACFFDLHVFFPLSGVDLQSVSTNVPERRGGPLREPSNKELVTEEVSTEIVSFFNTSYLTHSNQTPLT